MPRVGVELFGDSTESDGECSPMIADDIAASVISLDDGDRSLPARGSPARFAAGLPRTALFT
jgi:hypothetical protein